MKYALRAVKYFIYIAIIFPSPIRSLNASRTRIKYTPEFQTAPAPNFTEFNRFISFSC